MNACDVDFVFFSKPSAYRIKLFAGAGQATNMSYQIK
jgi:hypothetical protein